MTRVEMEIRKKRMRKIAIQQKEETKKVFIDKPTYKKICGIVRSIFGIKFSNVKIGESFILNGQRWNKSGFNCATLKGKVIELNPRDICVLIS